MRRSKFLLERVFISASNNHGSPVPMRVLMSATTPHIKRLLLSQQSPWRAQSPGLVGGKLALG